MFERREAKKKNSGGVPVLKYARRSNDEGNVAAGEMEMESLKFKVDDVESDSLP